MVVKYNTKNTDKLIYNKKNYSLSFSNKLPSKRLTRENKLFLISLGFKLK
jgi:hypothetical protein